MFSPSIASFLSTQRLTDRESPLWLLRRLKVGPWREPGGRGSTRRRSPTKRPQVRPPSAHSFACCLHPGRVPRLATRVTPLVAQARPLAPCRSHSPPAHSLVRPVSAGVSDAESALVAGAWSPPHVPPPRAPLSGLRRRVAVAVFGRQRRVRVARRRLGGGAWHGGLRRDERRM